jgi:DNA-binding NtrC family response regulator
MNEAALLIVDSDVTFSNALACFLSGNGCKVTVFPSIQPALHHFYKSEFEIAIIEFSDSNNREQDYSYLLNRPSGTALILTSGSHTIETEHAARTLSPAYYFVKPVDINDVFAVVVRIIEMNSTRLLRESRHQKLRKGEYHE